MSIPKEYFNQIDTIYINTFLGQGSYGFVAKREKITKHETKTSIVKEIKDRESAITEIQALARIKKLCNPYLSCITNYSENQFLQHGHKYMLWKIETDYIQDSVDLFEYIIEKKQDSMTFQDKLNLVVQMCKGLQSIHDSGVAHNDIKPENFLLKNNIKEIRYIDYGLACIEKEPCSGVAGTIQYVAPEIYIRIIKFKHKRLSNLPNFPTITLDQAKKGDIWSLGTVIYWFFAGFDVFESDKNMEEFVDENVNYQLEEQKEKKEISISKKNRYMHHVLKYKLKEAQREVMERYSEDKEKIRAVFSFLHTFMLNLDPSHRKTAGEMAQIFIKMGGKDDGIYPNKKGIWENIADKFKTDKISHTKYIYDLQMQVALPENVEFYKFYVQEKNKKDYTVDRYSYPKDFLNDKQFEKQILKQIEDLKNKQNIIISQIVVSIVKHKKKIFTDLDIHHKKRE